MVAALLTPSLSWLASGAWQRPAAVDLAPDAQIWRFGHSGVRLRRAAAAGRAGCRGPLPRSGKLRWWRRGTALDDGVAAL